MSNYKIIAQISSSLQSLLWSAFQQANEIDVTSQQAIVFKSPAAAAKDSAAHLSLWLYDITENEFVANQPMLRMGATERQAPQLGLNLHYMITPFSVTEQANLHLLAKTMQIFHDNPVLQLDGVTKLRITLNRESLEDMSRIWSALREPYRLSVCYQIKTVMIESQQLSDHTPIAQPISIDP